MPTNYEVRSGDTLSAIAQRHQSSLTRILNLNPSIEDPDRIFPGQVLTVPAANEQITSSCEPGQVADQAPCADEIVEVVHVTGSDELILLTKDELEELEIEEQFVCGPLEEYYSELEALDEGGQDSDERPADGEGKALSPLQVSKETLVQELIEREVIPKGMQSIPRLTEIKRLAGKSHYTYVRSDKIANHFRRYSMRAEDRKRSEGWLSREGVDPQKLRDAISSELKVKFNFSWSPEDNNPVMLALNQYYDEVSWSIWGDQDAQRENRDLTGFDASAEAQFLRFAAGASASGEFNPLNGKVHLQAKAEAQYNLAEGKATVEQAFPASNRSEIRIYYRIGGWDGERAYKSLGHFQARLAITASGFAGASALLAANVHVDSTQGLPSIKGIAAREHGQKANLEAQVFTGVRAGCQVAGSLLWVDVLATYADWKTLCQVGQKVEAAAGVGAEGELKLGFNRNTGKFYFNVHAGLVLGVGAAGSFLLEVEVSNVIEMIHFVYNGLLDSDFRYLELFDVDTEAFNWYQRISLFALAKGLSAVQAAQELVNSEAIESIIGFVNRFFEGRARENQGSELAENVLNDVDSGEHSLFKHSPPEVKGTVLDNILYDWWVTPERWSNKDVKVSAVEKILHTFQGWRDFEETMMRMNPKGEARPAEFDDNVSRLFEFIERDETYLNLFIHQMKNKVAVANRPVRLDPFNVCYTCGIG